ncbi:Gfo/Idh/MocA family protein [Tenggerimyces flavus]|uniref:Gfo/Idh/MocA family protein n=1 Tax=Tenggerimyces flavus TaxID=1708749 RepID=A0ABV7Y989_9ACTN|nr:Gfo/Idh/MocA family oxidoreductase [Tenggerimyces flavus]MBM7789788.1 putative dehydrogenase [Tenggerimyces flavus]
MKRLKVGVVGASIAHSADARENFAIRAHLPALKALDQNYEVTAVCTTRMESAKEAAKRFDVPEAYDSVERMLAESEGLDVVCVSVRPAAHYDVAIKALEAGKHVYCEHPGGISTEQATKLYQTALRNDVRTMTGHQAHFDPTALRMAELVKQGYVGRPLSFGMSHFGANYITPRPYFHRWLFDIEAGGRPAYRTGHSLERLMAVMGQEIAAVCADFTIQVPERPALDQPDTVLKSSQVDNMNYLLRTRDGAVGTLQVSNTAWSGTGDRFELYGTDGMLMLADTDAVESLSGKVEPLPDTETDTPRDFLLYGAQADVQGILRDKKPPEELGRLAPLQVEPRVLPVALKGRPARRVAAAWIEFAQAIDEGRDCAPSLHDTFKIHRIWDAAEESVRTHSWVDVTYK